MKEILCVVNFGESSAKVLDLAAKIAGPCGAHLNVLYAFRLIADNHRGNMTSLKLALESEARQKFHKLINTLPDASDLSMNFQPEIGFLSDRITAHLRQHPVGMIIIGQEQVDSSNEEDSFDLQDLIRRTRTPFIIVPAEVREKANV